MSKKIKLTKWESELLKDLSNGADIWGYAEARKCRQWEKHGWVQVVKAMNAPADGAQRQPYFGAILTEAGQVVLKGVRCPR